MRLTTIITFTMIILATSGCRTVRERLSAKPTHFDNSAGNNFSFVIQSDPPGADVYQRVGKEEKRLGSTPLKLDLSLDRRRDSPGGRSLRFRKIWDVRIPDDSPLYVQVSRKVVSIQIPKLILRKKNYEDEYYAGAWEFPDNLKQRVSKWKSMPIPRKYSQTVVFKTPTEPLAVTTVTIDCATGAAQIHGINKEGGVGRLIGTTPLPCKISYAPVRSQLGAVTGWKLWRVKGDDFLKANKKGDVSLNCMLLRDGYEPEIIANRLLFRLPDHPPEQQIARFQFLKPVKPEAHFKLQLDSLPSGASVYALNQDGSLGQVKGKTPMEVVVGLAQENAERSPGNYVHKDWRIWAPGGLVRWESKRDGTIVFNLTCAVYQDGFVAETIVKPIFQLKPGMLYPEGMVLTVPLQTAEQAAVREAHRLEQMRIRAFESKMRERPRVVLQTPAQPNNQTNAKHARHQVRSSDDETPRRNWWRRLWHRKEHRDKQAE